MNSEKDQLLKELLQSEWELLQASVHTLQLSINKCQGIGIKESYSFEELESFDSLTSKFNRTSDLFTQKVFRTGWMLLHEPFGPFIDMMKRAGLTATTGICIMFANRRSTKCNGVSSMSGDIDV